MVTFIQKGCAVLIALALIGLTTGCGGNGGGGSGGSGGGTASGLNTPSSVSVVNAN